jgi:hypothetical protein
MDILKKNIAAYITLCLLGKTDESLNEFLRTAEPRDGEGILTRIHRTIHEDPAGAAEAIKAVILAENEFRSPVNEALLKAARMVVKDYYKEEPELEGVFSREGGSMLVSLFVQGKELHLSVPEEFGEYTLNAIRERFPDIKLSEV